MDTRTIRLFSRRSILWTAVILVIGYALTAAVIQIWAQAPAPADGWVPVSNPSRSGSYGFAASDGLDTPAASTVHSATAKSVAIAYRPERALRFAAAKIFPFSPTSPDMSHDAKPRSVSGLFGRGFYSHP